MASIAFEVTSNSTIRLVTDDSSNGAAGVCTAILITLLLGATLNCIVVIAIFRTFLRAQVFNLLLASFNIAVLLDTTVNLTIASVFRSSWTHLYRLFGDATIWLCRFSAGFAAWTAILQVGCLVLLTAHRLSITSVNPVPSPVKRPKYKRYVWLTVLLWTGSLTLAIPLIIGVDETAYFLERYSCGAVNVTQQASTLATSLTLLTMGYCLPYLLLIVQWSILVSRILQERHRLQQLETLALKRSGTTASPQRSFSNASWPMWGYDQMNNDEPTRFIILLASLSFLQCLLVLPGEIYRIITQYTLPHQPHSYQLLHSDFPKRFIPVITPWYDGTLTWLRIVHMVIAPSAILIIHDSLRNQLREVIFSSNQIKYSQLSPVQSVSRLVNARRTGRRKRRKKSKKSKLKDEFTPVLLATYEGIHLRQIRQNPGSSELCCSLVFTDLGVNKSKGGVKKVIYSPHPEKKPPIDVMLYEEDEIVPKAKKAGKSVRFSQNVSEIPRRSFQADSLSVMGGKVEEISGSVSPLMAVLTAGEVLSQSFQGPATKRFDSRRGSEPITRSFGFRKKNQGSIEMEVANDSMTSSSSSVLLTLSQRMRHRDH